MQAEITLPNYTIQIIKETWTKPELTLLAIKEETLGNPSFHGVDTSMSS